MLSGFYTNRRTLWDFVRTELNQCRKMSLIFMRATEKGISGGQNHYNRGRAGPSFATLPNDRRSSFADEPWRTYVESTRNAIIDYFLLMYIGRIGLNEHVMLFQDLVGGICRSEILNFCPFPIKFPLNP